MLDFVGRVATNLDSYAAKLKSEVRGEFESATSRIGARISDALAKAAMWIAAVILLAVAMSFATAAAYQALLDEFSAVQADLIVAGAYIFLAVTCVVLAVVMSRSRYASRTHLARAAPTVSEQATPPPMPEPAVGDKATDTRVAQKLDMSNIAELLGAVGRPNEQAAFLVASEIAKSLTPPQLLAAGLAAGFVLGRKLELPVRRTRNPA